MKIQADNIFFFFYKKHEIFIQLEKSYNRESIQTLGENHKQLHTTLLNEPESPAIFLSLHVNIFESLFSGSSGGLIKRKNITCGFWAGKSLGQRRKHLKAQNRFLASEDHWETRECATEEGEQIAGTEE